MAASETVGGRSGRGSSRTSDAVGHVVTKVVLDIAAVVPTFILCHARTIVNIIKAPRRKTCKIPVGSAKIQTSHIRSYKHPRRFQK